MNDQQYLIELSNLNSELSQTEEKVWELEKQIDQLENDSTKIINKISTMYRTLATYFITTNRQIFCVYNHGGLISIYQTRKEAEDCVRQERGNTRKKLEIRVEEAKAIHHEDLVYMFQRDDYDKQKHTRSLVRNIDM